MRFVRNPVDGEILNYASRVYGSIGGAEESGDFIRAEDFHAPMLSETKEGGRQLGFSY